MLYGVDVDARYQEGLDVGLLARQGYTFLTTQASHGLHVASSATLTPARYMARYLEWIGDARAAGMIVGLYHWLTGEDGAAQARFFHERVVAAGGPVGMLIQLDCEADGYGPTMAAWAGEWGRLTDGHPFLIYSGAWWWPRTGGYQGVGITPHLWHSRYLSADTDTVPDDPAEFAARIPPEWWRVSYGGWTDVAILQVTSRGDAGGIGNHIDLNATRLSRADLLALTGEGAAGMAYPMRPVTTPAVLKGRVNGKLPSSILVATPGLAGGPTVWLVEPAARGWRAMCADALAAGHVLKVTGSYRPYADQERLFRERYTTTVLPGRPSRLWNGQRWYQRPGTAVAAVPGESNHGLAIAVDAAEERDNDSGAESLDAGTLAWLVANEERFGWSHEVPSEPWHIKFWAGDNIPAAVIAFEENAMPLSKDDLIAVWTHDLRNGPGEDPAYKVLNRAADDAAAAKEAARAALLAVSGKDTDAIIAEIRAQGEQTRAEFAARVESLAPVLAAAVVAAVDAELDESAVGEAIARELAELLGAAGAPR